MKELFDQVSFDCSRIITNTYSTSFSSGVRMLHGSLQNAVYSIYGFVRFADEIVDTFHEYDKTKLLKQFEDDFYNAMKEGISLNPILHSFQLTVKKYHIGDDLIQAFLKSMKTDISKKQYNIDEIREYIYGSADVVGLMCLKVFVNGDEDQYQRLRPYAVHLGSAFQKVNFLRDIHNDMNHLHRVYFPDLQDVDLTDDLKEQIIDDINQDFGIALQGIKKLPDSSKAGVYTAFLYYRKLTEKIRNTRADKIMHQRIRISDIRKFWLWVRSYLTCKLKMI